jgi:hypothetical protein
MTAGTLVGPAGGTWRQGTTARAQCACCGRWVTDDDKVWRYWVGLVARLTVCDDCAKEES